LAATKIKLTWERMRARRCVHHIIMLRIASKMAISLHRARQRLYLRRAMWAPVLLQVRNFERVQWEIRVYPFVVKIQAQYRGYARRAFMARVKRRYIL
jgi:hypothetical protein